MERKHPPAHPRSETKEDRQAAFLDALLDSITDAEACKKAGISPKTLYVWIKEDPEFVERLAELEAPRARNLEQTMLTVLDWAAATEERYEKLLRYPNLLMFALRGAMPGKYGYKMGVSQDEAKRIIDQLMGMKDDPTVRVPDGERHEDELDAILGGTF